MEGTEQVKRGRGGRPPAATAGDVEARLLAAATRLFLERGYDGTSCDQVALDARAGKASIYARYANKAALFAAVVDRLLARTAHDDLATDLDIDARLASVGMRVVEDALHADALALLRLLVAEGPRLGDTGSRAEQAFLLAGARRIGTAISSREASGSARALGPAEQFIDMILAPPLVRALLGEAVPPLLAAAPARIRAAIAALHATDALDGWT
jgi:AcrR family transcriptional regulator